MHIPIGGGKGGAMDSLALPDRFFPFFSKQKREKAVWQRETSQTLFAAGRLSIRDKRPAAKGSGYARLARLWG